MTRNSHHKFSRACVQAYAALLLMALMISARTTYAQDDTPPSITFSPAALSHFTSPNITAKMTACDAESTLGTVQLTFNGATPSATTTSTCAARGKIYTMSLTLQSGTNYLSAQACDRFSNCTSSTVAYYYDPPYRVAVTPDGGSGASLLTGGSGTATFTVANTGTSTNTVSFVASCSGAAIGCSSPSPIGLLPGVSQPISVQFTAPSTPGSATISLTASGSGASDAGSIIFPVQAPPPPPTQVSVTPDNGATSVTRATSGSFAFTVTNTTAAGGTTATLPLSLACPPVLSGCSLSPSSVTLAPGASQSVQASFTGQVPGHGALTVTATGPASDSGLVAVTVVDNGTPAVSLDVASVNAGPAITRAQCVTIAAGDGAFECGDLRLVHGLPGATTFTKSRAPTLVYNSRAAKGLAFIAANVRVTSAMPSSLSATLSINGASITKSIAAGSNCAEQLCRIVIPIDGAARNFATGLYDYTLTVQALGTSAPAVSAAGSVVVVNEAVSPFGAGWWLAGLERLLPVTGHANEKLWTGGDGDARVYTQVGSNSIWTVNPALDRPDTLEMVSANLWRRHGRNKVWVEFDSAGRHVATINRTGQRTSFVWTGQTLDRISLPVPSGSPARDYVFAYNVDGSGARTTLHTIAAPSANGVLPVVAMTYLNTWWVSAITDPDSSGIGFGYDAANNLIRRTNRRGHNSWFAYDEAGALKTDSIDMTPTGGASAPPIVRHYCAAETGSLSSCASGAQALASTFTQLDGPRTDVSDVTSFFVNRFGAPDSIVNALGGRTKLEYSAAFPLLTKAVVMPNGFRTEATYTNRALVDSIKAISPRDNGINAITTYSWDATWDMPISARNPTGQISTTHYDPTTGNIDWRQTGGDTTRFSYYADGLPFTIRQSNGAVDTLRYDPVLRNLAEYQAAGGAAGSSILTKQTRDSVGRVIRTVVPTTTDSLVETITYDRVGQDTLHNTFGGGQNLQIRQQFDPEGNVTLVSQLSTPNITGEIDRTYDFDAANRTMHERVAGASTVSYSYDPAGNLISGGRRSPGATTTYDALNRPIRKAGGYSTDTLTYDANGNLLTANNAYARISRAYYGGGWLKTETQTIATSDVNSTDFSKHVYDLRFTYDIGGRRDTLVHPTQFGGRTVYSYDPRTGELETVTDKAGNRFRHHYDVMGRLDSLIRLDGRVGKSVETFVYDLRSRIVNRSIVADSAQIGISDTLFYDRRDKVLVKHGGATDTTAYDAFGHVVYSDLNGASSNSQYTLDAMGHRSYGREDNGHLNITETDYQFAPGTERVTREASSLPHSSSQGDTTWTSYDEFGNLYYLLRQKVLDPTITIEWTTNNTYDSFNRLASHMMKYDTIGTNRDNRYTSGESYRYDALGRRIWYQAVRDTSCSVVSGTCYRNCDVYEPATACASPITRVVWDGDQILYEIRADGGVHADTFARENDDATGALYGRVAYAHGLGMDTPLSVIKGSSQIIPITNWRGQITQGTCPIQACSSSQVRFPQRGLYGTANFVNTPPPNWYGTLIEGQRDGSGYIYQRNRYLDPNTGRFTQEDPIGLAGGASLYGFANGDPISYSDPFGLWAWTDAIAQSIANWGARRGGVSGAFALNAGAALNAGLEATGINAAAEAGDKIGNGDIVGGVRDAAILIGGAKVAGAVAGKLSAMAGDAGQGWVLGGGKSAQKWASQMAKRGWTSESITEAIKTGDQYPAQNLVNKANTATRYVHPSTGRSVVVDDATREVIHVGGDGFKYE